MILRLAPLLFLTAFFVHTGCGDDDGGTNMCNNTCPTAFDGECDDGGEGSLFSVCTLGSDCGDCGSRGGGGSADAGRADTGGRRDSGSPGQDSGMVGCGAGCPSGQSCVLDRCIDNGGGSDDASEGGACMCDGTGDPDVYGTCSGTSDGCMGFGATGQLVCLHSGDGAGLCRFTCASDEEGTQGRCPDGFACRDSGLEGITGSHWFTCS